MWSRKQKETTNFFLETEPIEGDYKNREKERENETSFFLIIQQFIVLYY